ncbi:M48 family metalloprotease [Algicella marina]|uniref:M48 family metalloprotease n=1 Tax=Algicella marina TaxID=2683284 RepID=A0A6P1SZK6_9RHOB|nr:M48 family metalloprotease [Algicella marina]QHQ34469.1 M48 family metalloprotease [Algicella marina]
MLRLTPILLAILTAVVMYQMSSWRLKRQLDAQSTPLDEPRLRALAKRMAKALDLPDLNVHVYEIPIINGLAAPDGRIFVTRGFLDKMKLGEISEEEVASVIAHELGHVALGHSRRRMIDFSGQNVIRVILTLLLARFIPVIGAHIADFIAKLLGSRLSRQDEYEADAYAAALLTRAGIGVRPQINLFRKLEKMAPAGGMPAWMLSHPKPQERIAAIERLASRWGSNPLTPLPKN